MAEKPKYGIRAANYYDLFALESLLIKATEESAGLMPEHDQPLFFHQAIEAIKSGLVFLACEVHMTEKRERAVGCMSLEVRPWMHQPNARLLETVHFYVLPDYRNTTLEDGKTLLWRALVETGKKLSDGASRITDDAGQEHFVPLPLRVSMLFQVGDKNRSESKDELMRSAGLAYLGGSHIYVPQPGDRKAA